MEKEGKGRREGDLRKEEGDGRRDPPFHHHPHGKRAVNIRGNFGQGMGGFTH